MMARSLGWFMLAEQGFASIRLVPIRILDNEADGTYTLHSLTVTSQ